MTCNECGSEQSWSNLPR